MNTDSINLLDPDGMETVLPNPYSWTKVANVVIKIIANHIFNNLQIIILEIDNLIALVKVAVNNPPPIGFSYCEGGDASNTGPSGDGYSCGPWNDNTTAAANRAFLASLFLNDFPEFQDNELFLAGESYGSLLFFASLRSQSEGL